MARKNDNMPASARNDIAECRTEPTGVDAIRSRILTVRGVQVMLDRDLAELYGVPTGALNQAVKRNIERFPERFMFQLNKTEAKNLKSQSVISSFSDSAGTKFYRGLSPVGLLLDLPHDLCLNANQTVSPP